MEGESVDDPGAESWVGEGLRPSGEELVGCDRDGGLLFSFGVDQVTAAVPFTADDLPEYAGRLYDGSLTHPSVLRFVSWYALERGDDDNVPPSVIASMQDKIAAVEDAQRRGTVTDGFTAGQLLALALSVANMWQREGDGVRGLVPVDQRRETVVAAMRRLTSP